MSSSKELSKVYASFRHKILGAMMQMDNYLDHAPNSERFALCQEIKNAFLKAVELSVRSEKSKHPNKLMFELDVQISVLKQFVYIFYRKGYFGYKNGQKVCEFDDQASMKKSGCVQKMIDDALDYFVKAVKLEFK